MKKAKIYRMFWNNIKGKYTNYISFYYGHNKKEWTVRAVSNKQAHYFLYNDKWAEDEDSLGIVNYYDANDESTIRYEGRKK